MKATIKEYFITTQKKQFITLELLHDFITQYDELKDKVLKVDIKEWKDSRSPEANRYMWALCGKMADVLRVSKEKIYLDMLKEYGQSEIIPVWEKAEKTLLSYIKYYEKIGTSDLSGQTFIHYKVYKGSSEFDTKEMAIFIDGIVSECKELGIETMTPQELERLKNEWGK